MDFPSKTVATFLQARVAQGLTVGQLARRAGYHNLSKGAKRIHDFEQQGIVSFDNLARLATALQLPASQVNALVEADRETYYQGWLDWINTPIQPYLVLRYMATMYSDRLPLPDSIQTRAAAEVHASELCRRNRIRGCLVWSRRLSIWFGSDGHIESVTETVPDRPNCPSGAYIGGLPRSLSQSYLFDLSPSGQRKLSESTTPGP